MASPAAQQMLNSLSPDEQARVMASIAGNPNGLDDWYQAAARAGDPRAIRAGGANQSEDFVRFNEGTLTGWAQQFYDEAASRAAGRPQFRSMRGAEGFYDKPTECPPGMGPSGPNESDPCTTKGYSEPSDVVGAASPTGTSGPSQAQQDMSMLYSPLRGLLMNQGHFLRQFDATPGDGQAGVKGGVMGGGGMWWSPTQKAASAPVQTGGLEPKSSNPFIAPSPAQQVGSVKQPQATGLLSPTANTSSLTGVLAPLQSQATVSPLTSSIMPLQAQVRRKNDPLTGMLGPAQQGGAWF